MITPHFCHYKRETLSYIESRRGKGTSREFEVLSRSQREVPIFSDSESVRTTTTDELLDLIPRGGDAITAWIRQSMTPFFSSVCCEY